MLGKVEFAEKLELMNLQLKSHFRDLAWMRRQGIDTKDLERRIARLETSIKWL